MLLVLYNAHVDPLFEDILLVNIVSLVKVSFKAKCQTHSIIYFNQWYQQRNEINNAATEAQSLRNFA